MATHSRSNPRPRKTYFETVPVIEALGQAHEHRLAAVRDGAGPATHKNGRAKRDAARGLHILSLSYDVALLDSRQMLLEEHGYQVTSVVGLASALHACQERKYDLVIIGHSIPSAHKRKMMEQIRAVCDTPVLALQRTGERTQDNAEHVFNPIEGPRALLQAVDQILCPDQVS